MRFPWQRSEHRQSDAYADRIVELIAAHAAGATTADIRATAAAQFAAQLYGASMAMAEPSVRSPILTAQFLAQAGRALTLDGEWLGLIEIDPARGVALRPATKYAISGGIDPRSWRYRLTLNTPSGDVERSAPAAAVVHLRQNVAPSAPWRGVSPLAAASLTSKLVALLDSGPADEAEFDWGYIVRLPSLGGNLTSDVFNNHIRDRLSRKEAAGIGGGGTTEVGGGTGPSRSEAGARARAEFTAVRYGAQFTPAVVDMRRESRLDLLAACGIPVSLASTSQPGSAKEGLREFLHASLQPLAELIALELAAKLDLFDLSFGFDRLFAADIQARSRAAKSLIESGFEASDVARLIGYPALAAV